MKIQLLSDLHLESNPTFMPRAATGADVLVLAGDIGSYQTGSALSKTGDTDFGLARFSPLHGWHTPVLFVPGNHEYDGLDFDQAHDRLRETCTRLGIAVAEGVGSPAAPAELTWALIMAAMRRLPQYIGNLKHGAWQQSGLKAASMPPNFGIGMVLEGRTLGIWGYGRIGAIVAGYGRAFSMPVLVCYGATTTLIQKG